MDKQEKFLRAISYAIANEAWVDVSRLDPAKSVELEGTYLLRTSDSAIICRVPWDKLSTSPIADIDRLREIGPNGLRAQRELRSDSSPEQKALAWAVSMGYPIPSKLDGCAATILVVIGLFMFIVPGVLLLVWIFVQSNQYDRDMKKLIERWIDAGRPVPGEGIKEVTRLERIVETVEDPVPQTASIEQRLVELSSMKEKGLITEEEYAAMRKKALDL